MDVQLMLHIVKRCSLLLSMNEVTLSRILSTIVRTHAGLEDSQNRYSVFCSALGGSSAADSLWLTSWNIDVLVDPIKQLAPEANSANVIENLDREGFILQTKRPFLF